MRQPPWQRAASFAARQHEHEKRDDQKTPYFSHPARVAMTVCHLFGCNDQNAITAAFLHDVLENTDEGYDDIAAQFGRDVADLVAALTKNMMLPGKARDQDYVARLGRADWRARLVKLADEFDNYCDTLTGLKEGSSKELRKCRVFLTLARTDARKHPETARAIRLLKKLCKAGRLK